MKKITAYLLCLVVAACWGKKKADPAALPEEEQLIQDLNEVAPTLPEAPGKALVQRYCITCHSLQYIAMQPHLPEKTWQKTVDKMRKNFGAPIPEKEAGLIVKYLVRIKGTGPVK